MEEEERDSMKREAKRFLAFFLVIVMIVGMIPMQTQAATKKVSAKKVAVKKVTLNYTQYVMKKGQKLKLKATVAPKSAKVTLKWKSSNKKVATVNSKGIVTAKGKKGSATITVTAGKKKATCKITIGTPVKKITASNLKLEVGKSAKINASISPKKATVKKLTYKSNNTSVAKVNTKGKVTAVKEGKAKITITAADCNKVKKTITVTVTKANAGSGSGGSGSGSGDSGSGGSGSGDSGSGSGDSGSGSGDSGSGDKPSEPTQEKNFHITTYDGVTKLGDVVKPAGTLLKDIAAPYIDNKVFLGWYYDQNLSKKIGNTDVLSKDTVLYGYFGEGTPLTEEGSPDYLGKENVAPGFTITVDAHSMSAVAEDVKAALLLSNLTDPSRTDESDAYEKDVLKVESNGNGTFTVSAEDGFQEGAIYQLEILESDKVPELTFADQTKDVVCYNFSVKKEETMNLSLDSGVKYLAASDKALFKEDAQKILEYAGLAKVETDGESVSANSSQNEKKGTFTYTAGAFVAGDIVAVYEGEKPDDRNINSSLEEKVAYIEITAVNGTTYTYKSAEAMDVLFTPDVLPIDIDEGDGVTGWSESGTSFTIENEKLDFTTGYEDMGLDYATVVEPGDFVAFYSGKYGNEDAEEICYGKITKVIVAGETTIISYEAATFEEILASMDLYKDSELSDEQIAAIDTDLIAETATEQVIESGFAEEAGNYLAVMATQTDDVKELLGDTNLTLKDCIVTYEDGSEVCAEDILDADMGYSNKTPEVSVDVSKSLMHFKQSRGLRVCIALKYSFDVSKNSGGNKITIDMTAIFETEVSLGFSATGGAEWRVAWIFPYIYDYKLSGTIEQSLYTGIGVTATATLSGDEEQFGPDQMDNSGEGSGYGQKLVDLSEAIKEQLEESKEPGEEGLDETVSGGLKEKYKRFIANASAEWVDIVKVPLFEASGNFDPFYITAYSVNMDFVVSANLNMAIGMSFQYEKSQSSTFTLRLFHKNQCESKTVSLRPEKYQFDFYVMGRMGIRAGVRAKVLFGIFSTDIAGVGLQLEAGAYAKLWGYFYYCYSKEEGKSAKSSATGAVLIEVGAYIDLKLALEAMGGRFSYTPNLYSHEWPIWKVGDQDNVLNFAYDEDGKWTEPGRNGYLDTQFVMIRDKQMKVPEEIFRMNYLDLKKGDEGYASYDGNERASYTSSSSAYDDEKRFFVEISEPAFVYNPIDNTITVNAKEGKYSYEGTMTITWKKPDCVYASKTLSRTFELSWMDPDAGKVLTFDSQGGPQIRPKVYEPGAVIEEKDKPLDENMIKVGYAFGGWYTDKACTDENAYTIPKVMTMPNDHLTLYAKWVPVPNQYTVNYYYEQLSSRYELVDTVVQEYSDIQKTKRIYTDDVLSQEKITTDNAPEDGKDPHGFEVNKQLTTKRATVAPDGSTVVNIYYKRQIHTVTYSMGDQFSDENPDVSIRYRYEDNIIMPTYFMPGYQFAGWDTAPLEKMDVSDLTYTAKWEPNKDTPYYLEYYVKLPGTGSYVMIGGENGRLYREGETDSAVAVQDYLLDDVGFTLDDIKVCGKSVSENGIGNIDANGKLLIQYFYTGRSYAIHYDTDEGTLVNAANLKKDTYTHGFNQSLDDVKAERTGYRFIGWLEGQEGLTWQEGDLPNYLDEVNMYRVGDIYLKADWRASEKVLHLYDADGSTSLGTVIATYGQTVPALREIPKKAGYDFAGFVDDAGNAYYDGFGKGLVVWEQEQDISLKASWTPAAVEVNFDVNGGDEAVAPVYGTYKSNYPDLPSASREGYHLLGWTVSGNAAGDYVTKDDVLDTYEAQTLVAQWAPNTDTPYILEYYVESVSENNVPGSEEENTADEKYYVLYTSQEMTGTTGARVTVEDLKSYQIPGYTVDTENEKNVLSARIRPDGSTTLKLYYRKGNCHTVTYAYGNDIEDKTEVVANGTYLDLPASFVQNHQRLIGWMDGNLFYDVWYESDSYHVEEDVTLKAVWEEETYQISYRNNAPSGSGSNEYFKNQTLSYDTPSKVWDCIFCIRPQQDEEGNYTAYYEFTGWNTRQDGSGKTYMPGDELLNVELEDTYNDVGFLYAQWEEKTVPEGMVPYYVMYNIEDTSGMYRSEDQLILFGKEGDQTRAVAYDLGDELTAQDFKQKTIQCGDAAEKVTGYEYIEGYTIVEIKYARKRYTLALDFDGGSYTDGDSVSGNSLTREVIGGYGIGDIAQTVKPEKEGYTFLGWNAHIPSYMPLHDFSAKAQYRIDNTRAVRVEYYTENLDGQGYSLAASETIYGERGETISPEPKEFEGFETPQTQQITVPEDESGVIKYYYGRKTYTLSWDEGEGTLSGNGYSEGSMKYGAPITAPVLSRDGYDGSFRGFTGTMPAQDICYKPQWEAKTVAYTVMYRKERRTGTDTTTYDSLYSVRKEAKAGSIVEEACALREEYQEGVKEGYRKPMNQVAQIAGDGSTIIYFDYALYKSYLGYDFAGGTVTGSDFAPAGNYYYGQTLQLPLISQLKKDGCDPVGWYDASDKEQTVVSGNNITIGEKDVVYRLQWKKNTYSITYDLGEADGAENPYNPATYQIRSDFNISPAVCKDMAFEGWEWNGAGEMPAGVEKLDNGLVHVTADATGDISLKAKWSDETRIFSAALYETQDGSAPVYLYHYPVSRKDTLTLGEIAQPTRDGYLFSYWSKKVPKEDYGYYTLLVEQDTRVRDINPNTDFLTANWLKIVTVDGKKLISASNKIEFNIALDYLKAYPEYRGIYITGEIKLGNLKESILDTWEEGYLLCAPGTQYGISIDYANVPLFGENRGEIRNIFVHLNTAYCNEIRNDGKRSQYFGVITNENYGKITGLSLSGPSVGQIQQSGTIASDAGYVGALAGYNAGQIEASKIDGINVIWQDTTADLYAKGVKTTASIGLVAGMNAANGEINDCRVIGGKVTTDSGYTKYTEHELYMGGVTGTNRGKIDSCRLRDVCIGKKTSIETCKQADEYGYLCAGGVAGIDAAKGSLQAGEQVRGIYNCTITSTNPKMFRESAVQSEQVAGGIIGECNYGEVCGNKVHQVNVYGAYGAAGLFVGIYRSEALNEWRNVDVITSTTATTINGEYGIIAQYEKGDPDRRGVEVIELADMKSKYVVEQLPVNASKKTKTISQCRGHMQYGWRGDGGSYSVGFLDESYKELPPRKPEEDFEDYPSME